MSLGNTSSSGSAIASINEFNIKFTFYFTIISSTIGLPTNLISSWVFARIMKKTKTNNMGVLSLIQSLVDFLFLLQLLLVLRATPVVFTRSLYTDSDFSCKILMFLRRFMTHASSAVTVILTFDRFVAVCFQQKSQFMQRKSILLAIMLSSFLLIAVLDVPNLLFYLEFSQSGGPVVCIADFLATISSDVIGITVRTYLPLVLMAVMNGLIIRRIRISSRGVRQTCENHKENQFTRAVIAYDVFFLICSLPVAIYIIINDVYLYMGAFKRDPVMGASYNLWLGITLSISYMKQFLTFFMNLLFNKVFLKEFKSIFRKDGSVVAGDAPFFISIQLKQR